MIFVVLNQQHIHATLQNVVGVIFCNISLTFQLNISSKLLQYCWYCLLL